ncbi:TlpA disulfide reductase family protein [Pleionea sp. CnH1-48]|uniref:TlpA family protein disulfide reductase n=1 Tax=Pleionea sp. CnH1-48 TaxID=2954494 RepID=UPI002098568C|nr:TlpA disulfide reductase family protein [Pleionea sp. CnH1-48]MCO7224196.1 TlpA family protein disulfide reductase [Pleionea sp. CnH1-48]
MMYLAKFIGIFLIGFSISSCSSVQPTQPALAKDEVAKDKVAKNKVAKDKVVKDKYETYISAGQAMPLSAVTDIEGKEIQLDTIGEKKLVVLFATWCSDSQRAMKALNQSEFLSQEGLTIVAIGREQKVEEIKKWQDEQKIRFSLAADPDRSIYSQFAAAGIPRLIMVDENNRIHKMVLAEDQTPLDHISWK